jgi:hypothetical protein
MVEGVPNLRIGYGAPSFTPIVSVEIISVKIIPAIKPNKTRIFSREYRQHSRHIADPA